MYLKSLSVTMWMGHFTFKNLIIIKKFIIYDEIIMTIIEALSIKYMYVPKTVIFISS